MGPDRKSGPGSRGCSPRCVEADCERLFDSFCRCVALLPSRGKRVRSRSAGRNLKSIKQIGDRRVETPYDDLRRDNSRLALATFNVRQVSPVHVEMDGEIICM
jgi:hypothetical protein